MSTPSNRRHRGHSRGVDHISNLPDAILCHILSLVPTKSAMLTSILSKRWKYLWTKVTSLDVSARLQGTVVLTLQQQTSFNNFVDRVLLQNDVSYLKYLYMNLFLCDEFHVKSWLSTIARREIGFIHIELFMREDVTIPLPTRFFFSEKLVSLKLFGMFSISCPLSLHLPKLEVAHLRGLDLPDDKFLKMFSLCCPVLKELSVIFCHRINSTLDIESLSLETLKIRNTSTESRLPPNCIIRAPNLRCLHLEGVRAPHVIGNLSLLVEANLHINLDDAEHRLKFMEKVSGVKTLGLKIVNSNRYEINLPIFQNLTHLELPIDNMMPKLLKCTPMLKSLIIEYELYWEDSYVLECLPESLLSLKNVKFSLYEGTKDNIALVAYFLKAASTLKEMKIFIQYDKTKGLLATLQELLAFPRSSTSCQVNVEYLKC